MKDKSSLFFFVMVVLYKNNIDFVFLINLSVINYNDFILNFFFEFYKEVVLVFNECKDKIFIKFCKLEYLV